MKDWDVVIGVEVHVQLSTRAKLTCSCAIVLSVQRPNSSICPVCIGLPGALPTVNQNACRKAIMAGLSLQSSINHILAFDRKSYFYPDSPKSYQITQARFPICLGGQVQIQRPDLQKKIVRIKQIHLEEDAGKLVHSHGKTLLDFNRSGVPLIEIVTEPDMDSSAEVDIFLKKLRSILIYAGVSECRMQEGEIRADVNISLKNKGSTQLGVRTELKNMNSFKSISLAIEAEIARQKSILQSGKSILMQTLAFDLEKKNIIPMRLKESVDHYRYMDEFDILPSKIELKFIDSVRQQIQELPDARYQRFLKDYDLSEYDATILVEDKQISDYYEQSCTFNTNNPPKKIANWMITQVLSAIHFHQLSIQQFAQKIPSSHLSDLITLCESGEITGKIAKSLFVKMLETGNSPASLKQEFNVQVLSDESVLTDLVSKLILENPKAVQQYQEGLDRVFGFFVGQIMKSTKGQAEPQVLQKILKELLAKKI